MIFLMGLVYSIFGDQKVEHLSQLQKSDSKIDPRFIFLDDFKPWIYFWKNKFIFESYPSRFL